MEKGLFIVVVGPPGAGKTTVVDELLTRNPSWSRLVTMTSRKPRQRNDGTPEVDGEDYFFVSKVEFQKLQQEDDFLEWMETYGNFYGSSKTCLENQLKRHPFVLGIIDVKGAVRIKEVRPETVIVFLNPGDRAICISRLQEREGLSSAELSRRITNIDEELSFKDRFDEVVFNRDGDIESVLDSIETLLSDLE